MDDRQVSDSDAGTLPESVTDSMDELPPVPSAESDIDMEDSPSPRAALTTKAKVPSPEEIRQWLRTGTSKAAANLTLGLELYSPPRVLTARAARGCALSVMTLGFLSLDILTGWNFDLPELTDLSCQILQGITVAFLYLSPPCTMFSSLQTMWNKHRMSQAVWDRRWQQAVDWVEHCMRAIRIQVAKGQRFMFEHPARATSWKLPCVEEIKNLPNVRCISFDMCAFGMTSPMLEPIKKRTIIMTKKSALWLAQKPAVHKRSCASTHRRKPAGSSLEPLVSSLSAGSL